MQQQKQEELFEEVEVVDDAEEEEDDQETIKLSEIPKAQPKVKKHWWQMRMTCLNIRILLRNVSKLTNRFQEERQKQSAITYAESIKKQNEDLKARLDKLDTNYVGEFDNRVTAQAEVAKEAYKKALETGDADALYEAQQIFLELLWKRQI